jgi:hypothetical protein
MVNVIGTKLVHGQTIDKHGLMKHNMAWTWEKSPCFPFIIHFVYGNGDYVEMI